MFLTFTLLQCIDEENAVDDDDDEEEEEEEDDDDNLHLLGTEQILDRKSVV